MVAKEGIPSHFHNSPSPLILRGEGVGFCYWDSKVASFWSASEIVSIGKVHINSAFRTRQSRLLTWSDNIAPATGNPAGRRTSKG